MYHEQPDISLCIMEIIAGGCNKSNLDIDGVVMNSHATRTSREAKRARHVVEFRLRVCCSKARIKLWCGYDLSLFA